MTISTAQPDHCHFKVPIMKIYLVSRAEGRGTFSISVFRIGIYCSARGEYASENVFSIVETPAAFAVIRVFIRSRTRLVATDKPRILYKII